MKLVRIGRSSENDVVLKNDLNISRNHCEIFQDNEGNIFLTDLESANGCFINGKKVSGSEIINTNDIIKLGTTVLPWKDYIELNLISEKNEIAVKKKNESDIKINIEDINQIVEEKIAKNFKEASGFWIVIGYIFSVLGGWIGFGFGLNYTLGNYDKETKKNGKTMIIIGVIVNILFIASR
jgi:pSer/pThr/pTyr-binding forkhead associated (FHA) protein